MAPTGTVQEFTVEVVAPSNLEGGSEFLAKPYKVRIPDGGVTQGQRFDAVILTLHAVAEKTPAGRFAFPMVESRKISALKQ
jgi:hypothetical protein